MLPWWKHNQTCLLCGKMKSLRVGLNSITLGPSGADDDDRLQFGSSTDPTTTAQMGFNISTGRPRVFIDGSARDLAHADETAPDTENNVLTARVFS